MTSGNFTKSRFTTFSLLPACLVSLPVLLHSHIAASQTGAAPQRSAYTAGPVSFSHFSMPTDMAPDIFRYFEDVNGDGFTDIVATVYSPISAPRKGGRPGMILLNNGNNTFTPATGDKPNSEWVREILVEDFNGDGIADMFLADHGWDAPPFPGFQNQLLLGTGSGFRDATNLLPTLHDFTHNAAAGDIDGDGRIDILVTNNALGDASKQNYFLMNKGAAGFEMDRTRMPASLLSLTTPTTWAVQIKDLDDDKFPDLIVGRVENTGTIPSRVYWNPGNGDFSKAQVTLLPDMSRFVANGEYAVIEATTFDVNNDGAVDIQFTAYDRNFRGLAMQFLYSEGRGTRRFADRTDSCLSGPTQDTNPVRDTPYFLRLHDINRDGHPEVVAVDNRDPSANSTLFFESAGNGKLRAVSRAQLSSNPEVVDRLRWANSALSGRNQFGFAEVFVYNNNGVNTLAMNYIPISTNNLPAVANRFDLCSNQLTSNVAAGEFGNIELGFNLLQMAPTVRIQAIESTLKPLTALPEKASTFNSGSGIFRIPELHVDDTIEYRGLQFLLIDGNQLIFELVGSE
ncbi:MAG: VCBS repeat-containing protein [Pseudohongiella sp.]|nr:VCBS repeat-containing protein [Pseudohongiella sp.]